MVPDDDVILSLMVQFNVQKPTAYIFTVFVSLNYRFLRSLIGSLGVFVPKVGLITINKVVFRKVQEFLISNLDYLTT